MSQPLQLIAKRFQNEPECQLSAVTAIAMEYFYTGSLNIFQARSYQWRAGGEKALVGIRVPS